MQNKAIVKATGNVFTTGQKLVPELVSGCPVSSGESCTSECGDAYECGGCGGGGD